MSTRVTGNCPMGCGETLFVGTGGHVTCSLIECRDPGAAGRMLRDGDLLRRLRRSNVRRCETAFHHVIDSWSPLEWAGAMCGEAGEATNLAKKITRGDFGLTQPVEVKGVVQTAAEHLADEIADTVIYADLLCARADVSLSDAIVRKFNRTSEERGSDVRL